MGIKNTSASLGSFQEKPYINVREYVYLKYCTPVALIVCVCLCKILRPPNIRGTFSVSLTNFICLSEYSINNGN